MNTNETIEKWKSIREETNILLAGYGRLIIRSKGNPKRKLGRTGVLVAAGLFFFTGINQTLSYFSVARVRSRLKWLLFAFSLHLASARGSGWEEIVKSLRDDVRVMGEDLKRGRSESLVGPTLFGSSIAGLLIALERLIPQTELNVIPFPITAIIVLALEWPLLGVIFSYQNYHTFLRRAEIMKHERKLRDLISSN